MHSEIRDRDFPRARAEESRELLVQRVEPLGSRGATVGLRAEVEGEDCGTLVVRSEQRAVRAEGERPTLDPPASNRVTIYEERKPDT